MSQSLTETIRSYALSFPGAHEDFPWGECVVKVDGKIFVFLGMPREDAGAGFGVKLPQSATLVLERDWPEGSSAKPSGYGLGKSGWVSITAMPGAMSEDELKALVDESYAAVAKKKRLKELATRSS